MAPLSFSGLKPIFETPYTLVPSDSWNQQPSFLEKCREKRIKFTTRKILTATGALVLVGLLFSLSRASSYRHRFDYPSPLQISRQAKVAEAFQHAWDGYSRHCFGHDTLHPVSNRCEDDFGGWGATAIDALSTAIVLGKEPVVLQILEFIARLDLNVVQGGKKIQVFEVLIRHFGGMISAWDLLHGPFEHMARDPELRQALYERMVDLGDRLSCAFDTPSGVPHDWVDPAACAGDEGTMSTVAGTGTVILEFARLSDITGNETYVKLARRAEQHLLRPSSEAFPGLIGSHVRIDSGEMANARGSWGAYADSFYEYLIKAYLYNSDVYQEYLERWLIAADSTIRSVGAHPYGHPEWTLLSSWDDTRLGSSMESLSWFAGGNFILGGMVTNNQTLVNYGLSIADAAGAVYNMTTTGLGGEFVGWTTSCDDASGSECDAENSLWISNGQFRLRPEALETWYYAYRATRDAKYQDWAWAAFEAINLYCRTESGFSAISNVNAADGGGKTDVQESFVLAEVLKYIYLIHLEEKNAPFHVQDSREGLTNTWVFNTEAHPIRVGGRPK